MNLNVSLKILPGLNAPLQVSAASWKHAVRAMHGLAARNHHRDWGRTRHLAGEAARFARLAWVL